MKSQFDITGMSCAACSARVDKAVKSLKGVNEVSVNLLKNSMSVDFDESLITSDMICSAVVKAGYGASVKGKKEKVSSKADDEFKSMKTRLIASLCFTLPLFYISMGHMSGWPLPNFLTSIEKSMVLALTEFLLTIPVVMINIKYFVNGYRAIWRRSPNMDSLISLGSGAAVIYGIYSLYRISIALGSGDHHLAMNAAMDLYFESAAMILTLITLGKCLESRAKGRTTSAMEKLMDLSPKTATVIRDGNETEIPSEELLKGDIAIVRSGYSVPSDGIIIKGMGAVDESAITGESIPNEKKINDRVIGGTILKSGYIEMEITEIGENTALSSIIKLVDEATSSKAPIAKIADKVSSVFVPCVMAVSLVTAIAWLLSGFSFEFALSRAIAVLVISCPCALGLATPTAIMVGTGKAAEYGILFKGADSLENMRDIGAVVLDKTGTITTGKIKVAEIAEKSPILMQIAYSIERLSEHPLALAISEEAERRGISYLDVTDFTETAGTGVSGLIEGKIAEAGNLNITEKYNLSENEFIKMGMAYADKGMTPLYFVYDGELLGIIALADELKNTSKEAVDDLRAMGVRTYMVTGDNSRTAKAIQDKVGTDEFISDVLPSGKESVIKDIQKSGLRTAMVGDGINDAPALARSDIGIAIGAGTDIAMEAADVILMRSDLTDVVTAIQLGKATIRNIKENLAWALLYNTLCIPIAAGVLYPSLGLSLSPMLAAFCMSFSSVFVVSNALRLRFFKRKEVRKDKLIREEEEGTMTVLISGMMCEHCRSHVKKAIESVPGVESVSVSLEENNAVIKGNPDKDAIARAITEEGYGVVSIES